MTADVPVIVLVGGKAVRLGGERHPIAKPLIQIDGEPLLWHLTCLYVGAGYRDFILPLGHMGTEVASYAETLAARLPGCSFRCVETPRDAGTATRIALVLRGLDCETVAVTYGDGIADLDLHEVLNHHRDHLSPATLTGVHPQSDYGELLTATDGTVKSLVEKPRLVERFVNGGFMYFDRSVWGHFDTNRDEMLETGPLRRMVERREVGMYAHDGSWCSVDTWKDVARMEEMMRSEPGLRHRLVQQTP